MALDLPVTGKFIQCSMLKKIILILVLFNALSVGQMHVAGAAELMQLDHSLAIGSTMDEACVELCGDHSKGHDCCFGTMTHCTSGLINLQKYLAANLFDVSILHLNISDDATLQRHPAYDPPPPKS